MYELTCPTTKENLSEIINKFGGEIIEEDTQYDLKSYVFDIEPKKISVLDKELRLKGLRCLILKKPADKTPETTKQVFQKSPKVKLEELDKKLEEILEEKEVL